MVYGFVERYDGYINVESELGLGTSFCFYLPRCRSANVAPKTSTDDTSQLTGSGSILVVEDEVELQQLAREYLVDLGYSVFTAENAAKALEILSQENIDLLFSDVVMPGGMNGYKLAQQATQSQPQLKVLLTSGFTSKAIAKNSQNKFSENLLSKPYRQADLAKRIRLVLDKQAVS
jgi:CheY-like chemotaxis protein